MKVLLIQPPVRVDQDPIDIPAGLGILCSIAMQQDHQVAFMDLNEHRPIPSWKSVAKLNPVALYHVFAFFLNILQWKFPNCGIFFPAISKNNLYLMHVAFGK